jgi:hypothetical protein
MASQFHRVTSAGLAALLAFALTNPLAAEPRGERTGVKPPTRPPSAVAIEKVEIGVKGDKTRRPDGQGRSSKPAQK